MTGDPPRRWPDDSPEEDAQVDRAAELDKLQRWAREQKVRPLTDALTEHGMLPGDGEGWAGAVILPDWWDEIPEPGALRARGASGPAYLRRAPSAVRPAPPMPTRHRRGPGGRA